MLNSPQLVRFRTRYDRYREHFRRLGFSRPRLFVFVVTYGRTGSTLLQKLLNSADGVYVSGENHDVLRGLFEACRNARIALGGFGQHCKSIDDPWHGAFMVDPDTLERRLADAFLAAVLRPPRGHDVVGFKEIRYLVPDLAEQLEFMARVFVPAVFVFNRRDVGAVSRSAWWRNEDPEVLARKIEAFDAATDAFARAHPNCCVKLDYDEWTRDPLRLRPMFDLIDRRFDARKVENVLSVRLDHLQDDWT